MFSRLNVTKHVKSFSVKKASYMDVVVRIVLSAIETAGEVET